jgi:hypothetical protein
VADKDEVAKNFQAVYPGLDEEAIGRLCDLFQQTVEEFGEGEPGLKAFERRLYECAERGEDWAVRTLFAVMQAQGSGCQR